MNQSVKTNVWVCYFRLWKTSMLRQIVLFLMQQTKRNAIIYVKSIIFNNWLLAVELAMIMDRLYGGVCYAGIDTDPELKYPKGAGRVAFSNQQSYIAAISARFVQLQHNDIDKRVSKIAWNRMVVTHKTLQKLKTSLY